MVTIGLFTQILKVWEHSNILFINSISINGPYLGNTTYKLTRYVQSLNNQILKIFKIDRKLLQLGANKMRVVTGSFEYSLKH